MKTPSGLPVEVDFKEEEEGGGKKSKLGLMILSFIRDQTKERALSVPRLHQEEGAQRPDENKPPGSSCTLYPLLTILRCVCRAAQVQVCSGGPCAMGVNKPQEVATANQISRG